MQRYSARWSVGLILVGAVAVAGCEPKAGVVANAAVDLDTVSIRASIDSLAANVMRAHETKDAELFAASWAVDGVMSVPGMAPIVGRDSIVADFRRRPPLPAGAKMTIHPTEIRVMSADWAYVMGVDTLRMTPAGAGAPVTQTWTFLVLLRKGAEGWQTYREVMTPHQAGSPN